MKVFLGKEKVPVFGWTKGVPIEALALQQLHDIAKMGFVTPHIAVMPDVHLGKGATVGSVIPTMGAIIPAAVGVDIGCGMVALRLSLKASQLPDNLATLRSQLEAKIPVGQAKHQNAPSVALTEFAALDARYIDIIAKHPQIEPRTHPVYQTGTLGGGNHFIELCIDENQDVWVMLHSGSRGVGNRIGSYFIDQAKELAQKFDSQLPNEDLAFLPEGMPIFDDYVEALQWAQDYAFINRKVMLAITIEVLADILPPFTVTQEAINCHHNYVEKENHYGKNVWLTRKGAVRARVGDLGIIPGSMGAKSFIVEGLGNAEAFCSCSHGAGRVMSRGAAKKLITVEAHEAATQGVECRKDEGVLDESPAAYKDIDAVMAAQSDLVRIRHTLKQVMCIKG